MLSRIARAPRLSTAVAARLARPAVLPTPLGASAINPSSRTFASGHNRKPGHGRRHPPPNPPPSFQALREAPSETPNRAPAQSPIQASPGASSQPPLEDASQPSSRPPHTKAAKDAVSARAHPPRDSAPARSARDSAAAADEDSAAPPEGPQHAAQAPFRKLPDLTRGIPSTLEQEMLEKAGKSQAALETVDHQGSDGCGPRERKESYIPSSERSRRWWTRFMLLATAVGSSLSIVYMGRNWEDETEAQRHLDVPNGWSPGLWWERMKLRMRESVSYYQDPAFEKLLPDPDPAFERPYTLCLSLDDLLIHSEWSREHGWRIAKRPGLDYFVRYLSQYYELVLFTTVPFMYGESIVRKLDPFRFILWPLFREATKFEDGAIVKDLSYLNRDLSKVIILDTNPSHVRKQPENAIILEPWKGEPKDDGLIGLIPFLEYIHTMQYSDVRKVLKSFEGKHIPTEFARREAIARREFNKQLETQKSKHSKPSGVGALGSLFGLKPANMSMTMAPEGEQNPSEAFAQGKMIQDLARERGQKTYEHMEKEIRENGDKWLKEEQIAMEKAQKEAVSSMMGSLTTWFKPTPKPSGEV